MHSRGRITSFLISLKNLHPRKKFVRFSYDFVRQILNDFCPTTARERFLSDFLYFIFFNCTQMPKRARKIPDCKMLNFSDHFSGDVYHTFVHIFYFFLFNYTCVSFFLHSFLHLYTTSGLPTEILKYFTLPLSHRNQTLYIFCIVKRCFYATYTFIV